MARIVIHSLQELSLLQAKFRALKGIFPTVQQNAINEVAEEILDDIHTDMAKEEFSEKIIDATFVGRTDDFGDFKRVHFISNYVSDNGFDVSNAREEGTTHPNPTFPKKPGGVLRWVAKTGEVIFRKKSHPKGIERLLIIEKTLAKSKEKFKSKVADNLAESIQKVLGV